MCTTTFHVLCVNFGTTQKRTERHLTPTGGAFYGKSVMWPILTEKIHKSQWRIQDFPHAEATPKGRALAYYLANTFQNSMKINKIGSRESAYEPEK